MKFIKKKPPFVEDQPEDLSFRSIFKWGAPDRFKNPSDGFLQVIKHGLSLSDDAFFQPVCTGSTRVDDSEKIAISDHMIAEF